MNAVLRRSHRPRPVSTVIYDRNRRLDAAMSSPVEALETRTLFSQTLFADNFDAPALSPEWVVSTRAGGTDAAHWGLNAVRSQSGGQSAFSSVGPKGSLFDNAYSSDQKSSLARDNITLSGLHSAQLTFRYFLNSESGYDFFSIVVTDASGTASTLFKTSGDDRADGWQSKSLDLSAFGGQAKLKIEFRFDSDGSVVNESPSGVWVDDVSLLADAKAPPASIQGTVYNDVNSSRSRSIGEAGLGGWTIYLDQNQNGKRDATEQSTTSKSDGSYALANLDAGTYYVAEELNGGYQQTTPGAGGSAPANGFHIDVTFPDNTLTPSQQAAFTAAGNRWSEIITGDLPDVVENGVTIDDVRIDVSAPSIDGAGSILGQAAPTGFRNDSQLPFRGFMEFDSADLAALERGGQLQDVILHEMCHVLGFGTIWSDKGLISGIGGADPRFIGSHATATYNRVFGTQSSGVPVENSGGAGTRDSHWRESILNNELMTGYLDPGRNPLSAITVGAMEDLGYSVNAAAADGFTASALRLLQSAATQSFSTLVVGHSAVLVAAADLAQTQAKASLIAAAKSSSAQVAALAYTHTVTLATGESRTAVDFGNHLINNAPSIGSLSDSPDPVTVGGSIKLQASSVKDPDGSVTLVTFYRESNGRPGLQTGSGGDRLLGKDSKPADGFALSISTSGLTAGTYTYYATATDDRGLVSASKSTTNTLRAPSSATGTISGTLFNDVNGNGQHDSGESGLANWRVFLDLDRDGGLDGNERSVLTSSTGAYTFTGLSAGSYSVREVVASGYVRVAPSSGAKSVTLAEGGRAGGKDFSNFKLGSISGRKFNDANGNGKRDSGEAAIAGTQIYIDRNNNGRFDAGERSTQTDSSGNYTLSALGPGVYVVREVNVSAWRQTTPASGSYRLTLSSGKNWTAKDFGGVASAPASQFVIVPIPGEFWRRDDSSDLLAS